MGVPSCLLATALHAHFPDTFTRTSNTLSTNFQHTLLLLNELSTTLATHFPYLKTRSRTLFPKTHPQPSHHPRTTHAPTDPFPSSVFVCKCVLEGFADAAKSCTHAQSQKLCIDVARHSAEGESPRMLETGASWIIREIRNDRKRRVACPWREDDTHNAGSVHILVLGYIGAVTVPRRA